MQKRQTVLRSKLAEANHALQLAINARTASLQKVTRDPTDDKAHAALEAAMSAVAPCQKKIEALESALDGAERLDRADELDAKRAGWLAARDKAVELAGGRTSQVKALQAGIEATAAALRALEESNDAVLMAIYESLRGAEPHGAHDCIVFGQRTHAATRAVTEELRSAFVLALKDSGFGEVGLSLDGMLDYTNPQHLAHGNRDGLVAAVAKSATTIGYAIDTLHKSIGVLASDPVSEYQTPIPGRQESTVTVRDPLTGELTEELYTLDTGGAPAKEWGLPPGMKAVNGGAQ
jgi:hypothetical protein